MLCDSTLTQNVFGKNVSNIQVIQDICAVQIQA